MVIEASREIKVRKGLPAIKDPWVRQALTVLRDHLEIVDQKGRLGRLGRQAFPVHEGASV